MMKFGRMGAGSSIPWTPTKLFAAGEAGGLWDFSTLANLYQDSAGTTPCTAVGDPIGKVLDTSGRGNHLTQSTSTQRPTLGRMPATGVRNLLTYTEDFSNAAWGKWGCAATSQKITEDSSTSPHVLLYGGGAENHKTASVRAGPGTRRYLSIWSGFADSAYATFDLQAGAVTEQGLGIIATSISASVLGGYNCSVVFSSDGAIRIAMSNSATAGWNLSYTGNGSAYLDIYSAQFESGSTPTAYQKVGAAYDITESGVASVYTAYFDGVDDCLVSPSIDFTGTDKMSVFAGARKVDDTVRIIAELSANANLNVGSFFVLSGEEAERTGWISGARGSASLSWGKIAYSTIVGPDTAVLSSQHNIPGDLSTIRRNGVAGTSGTRDKGTGNFGNYPLYIGQRNAASAPYKGFLSALCTRGAATDAALVTSMEKWLAARTPGAVLP